MLFFVPSFSHLVCYFGYFFINSIVFFQIKKSGFWYSKFGSYNFGKTSVLVIFIIIYTNLCDCLLSPSPGAIICNCMMICIYIHVIVFYFVFSAIFIGVGQNLTNLITFWLHVC